jgi:hypothetical protein
MVVGKDWSTFYHEVYNEFLCHMQTTWFKQPSQSQAQIGVMKQIMRTVVICTQVTLKYIDQYIRMPP